MKSFVLLLFITSAFCNVRKPENVDRIMNIISNKRYEVSSYIVTTEDGYILDLIRIPRSLNRNKQAESDNASYMNESQKNLKKGDRPAVLMMHGSMSSAEDFVLSDSDQSLAFALVDRGYDVFLGNARGSVYGQKHTTLQPNIDRVFWKFCWDDVGKKDLPAIIDKILSITKQNRLNFIGHMEATRAFLVMASEKPEYNPKIHKMVALGPVVFMKNSSNRILQEIVQHQSSKHWIARHIGLITYDPSKELLRDSQTNCENNSPVSPKICQNSYFLFKGYNSKQLNMTVVNDVAEYVPNGGPTRELMHLAQMTQTGYFQSYDENNFNNPTTKEYDLSKVTVPMGIYYTPEDSLSQVDDVQTLIEKLPKVVQKVNLDELTNNLDLLYARNIRDIVNNKVMKFLKHRKYID